MNSQYLENSIALQERFHKNCLFKNILRKGRGLSFTFDTKGRLKGHFYCHKKYQGYDKRIHGGIMAAIIDESMVHCLMAQGVVGVTTNLSIKYRKPVFIEDTVAITTSVRKSRLSGALYELQTEILQQKALAITARGDFYAVNQEES